MTERELTQRFYLTCAQLEAAQNRLERLSKRNRLWRERATRLKESRERARRREQKLKEQLRIAQAEVRLQRNLRLGKVA